MELWALGPDGRTPILLRDGEYPEAKQDTRVALDTLPDGKVVSTIFLCVDHQFGGGPPLLFETMVFTNAKDHTDVDFERTSTWDEAEQAHRQMVAKYTPTLPCGPDRKDR